MTDTISLHLKNELSELGKLAQAVEQFGEIHALSVKAIFETNLVLDEIFTNIASYGFEAGKQSEIDIKMSCSNDQITLVVEDDGNPFDPLGRIDPDVTQGMEERNIGGLGIFLAKQLTSDMQYRREDGKNRLIMKKKSQA